MILILRTTIFGAVAGAAIGLIIFTVNHLANRLNQGAGYDTHVYVVFAAMLLCAVLGALLGLAASAGDYVKKKFESEEVKK